MNLLALEPIVNLGAGHSTLLSWLISLVILAIVVSVIVYLASKVLGPPNIPDPWRWILWIIVAIALLVLIFAAFGIAL
jgi:cation transporter-like permease